MFFAYSAFQLFFFSRREHGDKFAGKINFCNSFRLSNILVPLKCPFVPSTTQNQKEKYFRHPEESHESCESSKFCLEIGMDKEQRVKFRLESLKL